MIEFISPKLVRSHLIIYNGNFSLLLSCEMTKALPQLCGHSKEVRNRLSESLRNRRNELKNTPFWARAGKVKWNFQW